METIFLYHYYQQLRFGTLFKLLSKRNHEKKNKCLSDVDEFLRCKEAPKTIMHCLRDSEMINNILEKFINMETTIEHLFQYWSSSILLEVLLIILVEPHRFQLRFQGHAWLPLMASRSDPKTCGVLGGRPSCPGSEPHLIASTNGVDWRVKELIRHLTQLLLILDVDI